MRYDIYIYIYVVRQLRVNLDYVTTSNSIQSTLFIHKDKGKGEAHPRTDHEVPEGE